MYLYEICSRQTCWWLLVHNTKQYSHGDTSNKNNSKKQGEQKSVSHFKKERGRIVNFFFNVTQQKKTILNLDCHWTAATAAAALAQVAAATPAVRSFLVTAFRSSLCLLVCFTNRVYFFGRSWFKSTSSSSALDWRGCGGVSECERASMKRGREEEGGRGKEGDSQYFRTLPAVCVAYSMC